MSVATRLAQQLAHERQKLAERVFAFEPALLELLELQAAEEEVACSF